MTVSRPISNITERHKWEYSLLDTKEQCLLSKKVEILAPQKVDFGGLQTRSKVQYSSSCELEGIDIMLLNCILKRNRRLLFIDSNHWHHSSWTTPMSLASLHLLVTHNHLQLKYHFFPLSPFGSSSTMRIMEWKRVRKKILNCRFHRCYRLPTTIMSSIRTNPLSGKCMMVSHWLSIHTHTRRHHLILLPFLQAPM